jgi:hypothetical protein
MGDNRCWFCASRWRRAGIAVGLVVAGMMVWQAADSVLGVKERTGPAQHVQCYRVGR